MLRDHGFASDIANRFCFRDRPVQYLKVLMAKLRKNCEATDKMHVGKIEHEKMLRLEILRKWRGVG